MSKPTIKFQPVHPEDPTKAIVKSKIKRQKSVTPKTSYKIFLDNKPIGFIRVNPVITIFIKGSQLPGKQSSIDTAKATATNYIASNLKLFK